MDVNMKPFELEGTELLARAICHELDHLDGFCQYLFSDFTYVPDCHLDSTPFFYTAKSNCTVSVFYREEILYRELGNYPPAANMLAVQIFDKEEEKASVLAASLAEIVKDRCHPPPCWKMPKESSHSCPWSWWYPRPFSGCAHRETSP